MQNNNSHECSGCDGSGCKAPLCDGKSGRVPTFAFLIHSQECIACPVCLGSGRISDVRMAADAMVDAEQFLLIARNSEGNLNNGWYATEYGTHAGSVRCERTAALCARNAARAAFRAVPSLRSEWE